LDASDDHRPKNKQCYTSKLQTAGVILKSGVVLNAADVVVQTSHREARDQWIHNIYLAKKASVTVPPLQPSPPFRNAHRLQKVFCSLFSSRSNNNIPPSNRSNPTLTPCIPDLLLLFV